MEISSQALAQELKRGALRPAYLLFGEDDAAKRAALGALKESLGADPFNLQEFSGDSDAQVPEIVSACQTPPMFSPRRLILVRADRFGAAARRELAAYLKKPLETTTLAVLCEDRKPDAKDPLPGAGAAVVVFRALREEDAASRLREEARRAGVELDEEAAQKLVEEAGTEWGILKPELDKLLLFLRGRKSAGSEEVAACLGYTREANPFDFPRRLQARDLKGSLSLLGRMLREGSDPFRLLYQITSTVNKQFKAKRMLKSGAPPERIFKELRLNSYYDRDYLAQAGKLGEASLLKGLRACLETEVSLKSRSWLDPAIELEKLVAGLCLGGNRGLRDPRR